MFIVCGTSFVQPAASLTNIASATGADFHPNQPQRQVVDGIVTHTLRGPADTVLPRLLADAWPDDTHIR